MKRLSRACRAVSLACLAHCCLAEATAMMPEQESGKTARLVRETGFGKVAGAISPDAQSYSWLGIPYAMPPVGSLRWKAPVAPAPWNATLSTKQFGSACMQPGEVKDKILGTVRQSEDCLTLNIWSPATGERNLPVLVMIHGGSNMVGYGGSSLQWGDKLAGEQKIVVVTLNYRLNLFGWLSHRALKTGKAEDDSGNFGTLDIIQALKFVRDNIASFGGDPKNVTLAGQSAGAKNVWSLIVSPQAKGLFHQAMPMSGFLLARPSGSTGVVGLGVNLLRQLAIDDGHAVDMAEADAWIAEHLATEDQQRAYLYGKSATALIQAYRQPAVRSQVSDIIYDGFVMPESAAQAFKSPWLNRVPVLAGITNEEGKYWGHYFGDWKGLLDGNADAPAVRLEEAVRERYLPADKPFVDCRNTGYNALMLNARFDINDRTTWCTNDEKTYPAFFNTTYFWNRQHDTLQAYQSVEPRLFAYNFAWNRMPEPMRTAFGAAHVSDLPFIFNTFPAGFTAGYSSVSRAGREALGLRMRQFISRFMRSGDPNDSPSAPLWMPWSADDSVPKRLILDADDTSPKIGMSASPTPLPAR